MRSVVAAGTRPNQPCQRTEEDQKSLVANLDHLFLVQSRTLIRPGAKPEPVHGLSGERKPQIWDLSQLLAVFALALDLVSSMPQAQ